MKVSLEYIAETEKIFSSRDVRSLPATDVNVKKFQSNSDLSFYLVLSTDISKDVLLSKSFESYDYFSAGIDRFVSKGQKTFVGEFFKFSPIFREGEEHLNQRKHFFKMLDELNKELISQEDALRTFILNRASKIKSPLDFAKSVTIFCLAHMITLLINVPNRKAIKALLLRSNVWRQFFDYRKHLALEQSLTVLNTCFISNLDNEEEKRRLLLAQSLIIMGYDPVVGTICASAASKDLQSTFAQDVYSTCPTTYVTRICTEDVVLKGVEFSKGSIVTLTLLPNSNECSHMGSAAKSLSFGLGSHLCIGKRNSLLILEMAERVWRDLRGNIVLSNLTIDPDGAFLVYK